MPSTDKYCEDCRFYRAPNFDGEYGNARCRRPRGLQPVEMVARAAKKPDAFCDTERGSPLKDACGPEAKFFEAKEAVAA